MRLHVYLSRTDFLHSTYEHTTEDRPVYPSSAMTGMRASMVYIHGPQDRWDKDKYRDWLQLGIMPRLEDANPARVVWCHD